MAETTQLDAVPTLQVSEEAIRAGESLRRLRERKLEINSEIRALLEDKDLIPRLPAQCLRCGYSWYPYDPFVPPITCARCGTTAWHLPPTATSRKPSDVPSPSWRRRKGKRTQKRGDTVSRYRVAQKRRLPRSEDSKVADRESIVPPWEREFTPAFAAPLIFDNVLPPPPAIPSALPPPPAITPSLSERFARLRGPEEMEPQPEVVSSRAIEEEPIVTEPELKPEPEPTLDAINDLTNKLLDDGGGEIIADYVFGKPQSDAEREELAKAQEETWPTTRSDDD